MTRKVERVKNLLGHEILILRNSSHTASARNKAKRVTCEIGVTGFERRRNVGNLTLFGVEIVDGIKTCCSNHVLL